MFGIVDCGTLQGAAMFHRRYWHAHNWWDSYKLL